MDRLIPLPHRRAALAWAAVWALVAGAVYWSAVRTSWGQRLDDGLLERWHSEDVVVRLVATLIRSGIPLALCAVVLRLCLATWRAGRRHAVVAVGLVVLATVVLSPLLRDVLLPRPDLGTTGMPENTLPSNHMAFTTALAVAVVVLRRCGARWAGQAESAGSDGTGSDGTGSDGAGDDRRVGALLAVLVVAEAVVNLTTYAHRPADMVAGFAVAMMLWALALGLSPARAPGTRADEDPEEACPARTSTGGTTPATG